MATYTLGSNLHQHPSQGALRILKKLLGNEKNAMRTGRGFCFWKTGVPASATANDNPEGVGDICVDVTNNHAYVCTAYQSTASNSTNQVNTIPFVDSSGSGTFKITVTDAFGMAATTPAITYSATAATLVTNINTALNLTFGTSAVVASGATLAAMILTFSGSPLAGKPIATVQANLVTGSTGYTINGSGTVGTPSTCAVSVAGVAPTTWTLIV